MATLPIIANRLFITGLMVVAALALSKCFLQQGVQGLTPNARR